MAEEKTDWEIHFSLSEKIDCDDNLPTRLDLEFDTEIGKSGQKSINGFTVKANNVTKETAKQIAEKKANIFTDLLALTSGTSSNHHMDGTRRKKPTGGHTVTKTFTISYSIRNNADLGIQERHLTNLLEGKNPEINQQMKYVNKAMNSIKSRDPASAIKDLYLACNQNPQGNLVKYKSLRNALSHEPVFSNDINNIQRDFGNDYFDFTPEGRFDYASTKNQEHLTKEANNFLNQVRTDIKNKI